MEWKGFAALIFIFQGICGLPEQGAFEVTMNAMQSLAVFTKSMHNNTNIKVKVRCDTLGDLEGQRIKVNVKWLLRWTPCADEYVDIDQSQMNWAASYLNDPQLDLKGYGYKRAKFRRFSDVRYCGGEEGLYLDLVPKTPPKVEIIKLKPKKNATLVVAQKKDLEETKPAALVNAKSRRRRQADDAPPANPPANPPVATNPNPDAQVVPDKAVVPGEAKPTENPIMTSTGSMYTTSGWDYDYNGDLYDKFDFLTRDEDIPGPGDEKEHVVTSTWETGVYVFIISITPNTTEDLYEATVDVRMKGPFGYLSAIEWPLLPFYGTMCLFYVVFGLAWMMLSFCNWRDLLRIQFWIGGVIFLGMLEKAVFFAEYEAINSTGRSVKGAMVMAELVSCLKRTLARMLVIIVSLGFGIVKPRLGPMLHRVLAMGGLYFVLCAVEGCIRVLKPKSDQSNGLLLATIPLAVLDAAICWWIFTALVQTTRTLRLRRNLVKLSLYRHFTNTLIFAVLASVAFMIWSITQHRLARCLKDWRELWVDDAFWHLLFSIILMVIMILWRPNANNQRYAFSPLMDAADDEAVEPMMNDAFDGMKMRNKEEKPRRDNKNKAEDDLKWIEDNIPASVTDTALPSLLDSDEEIMNTKYEMSKME